MEEARPPWRWAWMVAAGSALAIFVLAIPRAVESSGAALDESWRVGLILAARAHHQWGAHVVFTYGPLGYMDDARFLFVDTWLTSLAAHLVVHLVFVGAIALVLLERRARPGWWLMVALLFLLPLPALPSLEHECVIATFALLAVAMAASGRLLPVLAAGSAGALIGFLALVKGTSLLSGAAILAVFAIFAVRPAMRPPVVAAVAAAAAAFLLLWLTAGQDLAGIPGYMRASAEVITGYGPAAGLDGNIVVQPRNLAPQLQAVAAGFAVVAAQAAYAGFRRDRAALGVLLLSLPILFVDFKEGFIRFGANQTIFYAMVILVEAVVLVSLAAGWRRALPEAAGGAARGRWRGLLALLPLVLPTLLMVVAAAAFLGVPKLTASITVLPPTPPLVELPSRLATYGDALRLVADPAEPARLAAATRDGMREAFAVDPLAIREMAANTTDIAPHDIGIAYAYNVRYQPRPVLQTYSGYTPYLDRLDAAAWGPGGPARLLLSNQSVDGRYAAFDEPAAFRVMLENYAVIDAQPDRLLMARHPPQRFTESVVGRVQSAVGHRNRVPRVGDGAVYAFVEMHPSLAGRLLGLIYKPPPVAITLDYGADKHRFHRFVPAVAADGIFLSSYIDSNADLASVVGGTYSAPITSFTITVEHPLGAYDSAVGIEYRVRRPAS